MAFFVEDSEVCGAARFCMQQKNFHIDGTNRKGKSFEEICN